MDKLLGIKELDAVWIPYNTLSVNIEHSTIGYLEKGGVWHWVTPVEAEDIIDEFSLLQREDGSWHIFSKDYVAHFSDKYKAGNMSLYAKWCKHMKEGDTIDRFKEVIKTVKLANRQIKERGVVDNVVTRISIPDVYRSTDNPTNRTFDYVRVECNLRTTFEGDRKQYIREHIKEITKAVLDKVSTNGHYKAYGVPVNFLKVANVSILRDMLIYIFELKDIPEKVDSA